MYIEHEVSEGEGQLHENCETILSLSVFVAA